MILVEKSEEIEKTLGHVASDIGNDEACAVWKKAIITFRKLIPAFGKFSKYALDLNMEVCSHIINYFLTIKYFKSMKTTLVNYLMALTLIFSLVSCGDDEPGKQDAIFNNLTTSITAYNNAINGDWIAITKAEYDSLANNVKNISTGGLDANKFTDSSEGRFSTQDIFVALTGTDVALVPENSYVFAFKYVRNSNFTSDSAQVKISSTASNTGFSNIGSVLPSASGTTSSTHYFVLKGSDTQTAANSSSYIGFYTEANTLGYRSITSTLSTNYSFGDKTVSATSNNASGECLYQTLSTTEKQW